MGAEVAIPMILGGLQVGLSFKQAQDAKKAAKRNAALEEEQTAQLRAEQALKNKKLEAKARAYAAASGVSGASQDIFLRGLEQEGIDALDWINRVGSQRASTARYEGQMAATRAYGRMFGQLGDSYAIWANSGKTKVS